MASSLPNIARAMERWSCETVCEVVVGIVENTSPSCYNIDDGNAAWVVYAAGFGRLAQLVRALPTHGRGQRFKSFVAHHFFSSDSSPLSKFHSNGKGWCPRDFGGGSFYLQYVEGTREYSTATSFAPEPLSTVFRLPSRSVPIVLYR